MVEGLKAKLADKRLVDALNIPSILSFEAKLEEYAAQLVYLKSNVHNLDSLVFSGECIYEGLRYASACLPLSDNDKVLVGSLVESFSPEAGTEKAVKVVCGVLGELHGELDRTTQVPVRAHLWNIMTKFNCQQRQ